MPDDRLYFQENDGRFSNPGQQIGIARVALDGRFLHCNQRFAEITGYSADELQALSFQDITHPDDLAADVDYARRLACGEIPTYYLEKRYLRKDGRPVWVRLTGSVVRDDTGAPQHFIAAIEDIEARKFAEAQALRWQRLFEAAEFGLAQVDLEENRFIEVNPTFARQRGYTPEELKGRSLLDIYPEEAQNGLLRNLQIIDEYGHAVFETVHLCKDGSRLPVLVEVTVIKDSDGQPVSRVAYALDITERKRDEAALQRYRLIADHSRDIILFIRRDDGRILDANFAATKAYGYSHDELLGLTIYDLRTACSLDQAEAQLAAADERGSLFETTHRRKNGTTFPVGVSSQGSTINGERMLISVVRDITQRKLYEEELLRAREAAEAASQAKSQFLANVSHEIRTPMTVFLGALEQLQQLDRNPQRRQLLDLAEQSARRLHALINDVLDFSRIEANRVELEAEPFDLSDCLGKVVRMMSPMAAEKGLALQLELAPAMPRYVVGDQYRLEQVLLNLISNAIKFTGAGEVTVAMRVDNDRLAFDVSDTGIGIPEDKHELIFQAFSQIDNSSTRRFGGTGLGLAISRRLVELMGGTIGVHSRIGGGSVFSFTLPLLIAGKVLPTPAAEAAWHLAAVSPPRHILLAEDNPLVRDIVLTMLASRGWTTVAVASGGEALAKWQQEAFDVILMDLQMPDMDGLEATRRIRSLAAGQSKKLLIIGLTAHATLAVREECLRSGMDEVLVKPFEAARLYTLIERGL